MAVSSLPRHDRNRERGNRKVTEDAWENETYTSSGVTRFVISVCSSEIKCLEDIEKYPLGKHTRAYCLLLLIYYNKIAVNSISR